MKIVINGAGIAGPTLAYWLRKSGHDVLLVEHSPQLRSGGYAIDFWGIGYDIAEKMRLLPRIKELGYLLKEVRYVNRHGRKNGGFSVEVFDRMTNGRFIELRRSDLAATIYSALDNEVETLYGDSVSRIEDAGSRVYLEFEQAPPREVDLVIGADGLHSRIRRLVFGSDTGLEVSLGYHIAAFELKAYLPRDELVAVSHAVSGKQILRLSLPGDTTLFLFVFRDEYLPAEAPSNALESKAVLTSIFADAGWECPRILARMGEVENFYFDRVSQIRMDQWAKGRAALIGDAAACVSLVAGEGTGLAMAEAYVLAGELQACCADHSAAFIRYQEFMMPFLKRKQASAAKFASSIVPKTHLGIAFRNHVSRLLNIPFIAEFFIGRVVRDDIKLPDYRF